MALRSRHWPSESLSEGTWLSGEDFGLQSLWVEIIKLLGHNSGLQSCWMRLYDSQVRTLSIRDSWLSCYDSYIKTLDFRVSWLRWIAYQFKTLAFRVSEWGDMPFRLNLYPYWSQAHLGEPWSGWLSIVTSYFPTCWLTIAMSSPPYQSYQRCLPSRYWPCGNWLQ